MRDFNIEIDEDRFVKNKKIPLELRINSTHVKIRTINDFMKIREAYIKWGAVISDLHMDVYEIEDHLNDLKMNYPKVKEEDNVAIELLRQIKNQLEVYYSNSIKLISNAVLPDSDYFNTLGKLTKEEENSK
jgi:hypothetical protein